MSILTTRIYICRLSIEYSIQLTMNAVKPSVGLS